MTLEFSATDIQTLYLTGDGSPGRVLTLLDPGMPDVGSPICRARNLCIVISQPVDMTGLDGVLARVQASIPRFAGEFWFRPSSRQAVEAMMARVRELLPGTTVRPLSASTRPLGANEKNHVLAATAADWLFFIDPDLMFTRDLFVTALNDLCGTGAHFLVLPVRNQHQKAGWWEGVVGTDDNGDIVLQARRLWRDNTWEWSPSHDLAILEDSGFLARRTSLVAAGGFHDGDDGVAINANLSARIFASGYKVAVSSYTLRGDVPAEIPPRMEIGTVLHRCEDRMEDWLKPYGLERLVTPPGGDANSTLLSGERIKVALVIDVDFWAFGNIARQVSRYLADEFEFVVIPVGVVSNINQVLMLTQGCRIVHFFWREVPRQIGSEYYYSYAESLGFTGEEFDQLYLHDKLITTSVYDHLLLEPEEVELRAPMYRDLIAGYTVSSQRLHGIYSALPGYPAPTEVTEDGVDLGLFRPQNLSRFDNVAARPLRVGWVGNSKWEARTEDFKGLHTLLKPALEELAAEGWNIMPLYADRQDGFIPHHLMPDYYAQIDVYVCPSKIEGTPNPVLEAMACGVPVISTDVGIVPQAFGPLQKEFMLPERSKEALKVQLRKLLADPSCLRRLSDENLQSIQDWSWEIKAQKFRHFFHAVLNRTVTAA
ncbi:glycosyltransferase [Cupriavidus sp. AU9028]|uniref:glycosyltransferase n=1 Tax=Cupriavidus sp. AU9028 TaxID=2871157 RepID=UPI001C9696D1|nr:glycosyltransferase [Cupriavidus sp. AU9028]MBY4898117.1 glycosyltransferase [Cupriavidus sp. AU9028]